MNTTINPADHRGLAALVAKKYSSKGRLPFDDLFQEAMLGVVRASEKFDPSFGCAFSTYANWWIRAYIKKWIRDKSRQVRLPARVFEDLSKRDELPPAPTSLDSTVNKGNRTYYDITPSELLSPEQVCEIDEERAILWSEVAKLTPKEQTVLRMRFEEEKTLPEIGEHLHLTKQRIDQIQHEAFEKLKPALRKKLGRAA